MSNETNGRRFLAAGVFLGFVNALWALFQWAELLLARNGGTPFCSVDETFNCAQVWDSAFAVTVHNLTQIPLAGWGLIWGIARGDVPAVQFFLGCVVVAGLFGGATVSPRIIAVQAVPAAIGLGLTFL